MSTARLPLQKRLGWYIHLYKTLRRKPPVDLLPLLAKHVAQDGTIIDANAGMGQFALLFAQAVPQGHVYAFEPHSYARSILSRVIATKQLRNVSLFPVGLGSEEGVETPASASGCPVMNAGKPEKEKLNLTTLDLFASRHNLRQVNFIRATAGEDQMHFLNGAAVTLDKHRPALLLNTGTEAEEMWIFLKALNYRIDRLDGEKLTPLAAPVADADIWCTEGA